MSIYPITHSPLNLNRFRSTRKCLSKPAIGRQNFADLGVYLGRHCRSGVSQRSIQRLDNFEDSCY